LEGQIRDLEALVGALGVRYDWSIADEWIMNAGIWDQVRLEFVQIDVKGTIKSKTRSNRADNLGDQAVEMFITGTRDIQITTTDIIDSFIIDQKGTVGVFDSAVGRENSVVGFDDSCRNARGRVNSKLELGFLSVVGREALQEESAKTRSGTTSK
jgi:hypothetical protein